jgi:hypothetical protein
MIVERNHTAFIPPNENDIIWRYMNLEKFISLLERKSLFFCRADRFSDPFEGSIPRKEAENRIVDRIKSARFSGKPLNVNRAKENIKALAEMHQKFKRDTVINCWQINKYESDGMWQLYLKSNEGVSIKSSVKRIINALEKTQEKICISKVRYIDYDQDIWFNRNEYPNTHYNYYAPLIHKRIEFEDESELRLLYHIEHIEHDSQFWIHQEFEKGMMISVELDILIDKVIIPPSADIYIEKRIKDLLDYYKLDKPIIKSKLSSEPIY